MFTIKSHFIAIFKVGDNINHNLQILSLLYRYFDSAKEEDRALLRKPIIIGLVSITEAILYDFHKRINLFTNEGVKNLPANVMAYIRGKKLDELGKYIDSARKHNLFQARDHRFYDILDELRKLRNRVHIQNTNGDFEPDECDAFSEKRRVLAEKVLEKVMRVMSAKYPRRESHHFVEDFTLPWTAHFPEKPE